jgi:hypothetical protein
MAHVKCPSCQNLLDLGPEPFIGQSVYCHSCEITFDVVWLLPVELAWPEDLTNDAQQGDGLIPGTALPEEN